MTRAAAVIPSADGRIALIERQRNGRLYYVFPGGGVEPGESPAEAMVREVREELGLVVRAERLLAEVRHFPETQYYYLASIEGGRFGTGTGLEMTGQAPPERGSYRPVWLSFGQMKQVTGWPKALFEIVAGVPQTGWPASTLQIDDRATSPDAGDVRRP